MRVDRHIECRAVVVARDAMLSRVRAALGIEGLARNACVYVGYFVFDVY